MTVITRERRRSDPLRPAPPQELGITALRFLAAVAIPVALSANQSIGHNATTGMIASFLLAPIWLPTFVKVPGASLYLLATGAFLVAGLLMSWVSLSDHEVSKKLAVLTAATFAMSLLSVGALYWACRVIGIQWVIGIYAVAWLFESFASPGSWETNPWKYGFVLPVSLIVFVLVDRQRFTTLKIIAAISLAVISIFNDSRSVFAVFLLTTLTLGWQRLRSKEVREPSLALFLTVAVAVSAAAYYLLTRLLVSGALGAGLKTRSEAQVEASGSLLLGGRPEWTVTIRLFRERPWGFGFGTIPSPSDYELGRQGFASIHLSSQENYLKNYMFDGSFSLHSIVADMWVAAGPVGIALVLVILSVLLGSLARDLAHRTASVTQIFLTLLALWHIGFSPFYSNLHKVTLALAVTLATRAGSAMLERRKQPEL